MMAAEGILTTRGGLVSHAAVVARGWGKPAVVGAEAVRISGQSFTVGGVTVSEGDFISLDGTTGEVALGAVPLTVGVTPPEFDQVLGWADDIRRLGVRTNGYAVVSEPHGCFSSRVLPEPPEPSGQREFHRDSAMSQAVRRQGPGRSPHGSWSPPRVGHRRVSWGRVRDRYP